MKKFIKTISLILAAFVLTISLPLIPKNIVKAATDLSQYGLNPSMYYVVDENENFIMGTTINNGALDSDIFLVDKRTKYVWRSSPIDIWQNQDIVESEKYKIGSSVMTDLVYDGYIQGDASLYEQDLSSYKVNLTSTKDIYMEMTYTKLINNDIKTERMNVVIPIKISLEKDYMYAEIILANMIEEGPTKVAGISLLPFFGSADTKDQGYYMIPDGSGALMNYNDKSVTPTEYYSKCYGDDILFLGNKYIYKLQTPTMPVIGINRKEGGMTMFVDQGSAYTTVCANVSTELRPVNYAYFKCSLRDADSLMVGSYRSDAKDFRSKRGKLSSKTFGVRYYPTVPEKNTYNDSAEIYRNYLIQEQGMKQLSENTIAPLFVDTLGAIKENKSFLGIPYEGTKNITTYNQAGEMIDKIRESGYDNIVLRYQGWLKGGMVDKTPNKVKADGGLGGKGDLQKLIKKDKEDENLKIFFDEDFTNLFENGNGCSNISDAIVYPELMPIGDGPYKKSTKQFYSEIANNVLTPKKSLSMEKEFLSSAKDFGITSVALKGVGDRIFSTFNDGVAFDTNAVNNAYQEMVTKASEAMSDGVMIDKGNIDIAKDALYIMNSPLESSKYDLIKREVPFVQMVLRGYKNISGEVYNHQANKKHQLLKSLETGTSLLFSLFAADADAVKDTIRYDERFADNIDDNLEILKSTSAIVNPVYKALGNSYIVKHEILADGVNQTTFSNGVIITVNYNDNDYQTAEQTIKANDFRMAGAAK